MDEIDAGDVKDGFDVVDRVNGFEQETARHSRPDLRRIVAQRGSETRLRDERPPSARAGRRIRSKGYAPLGVFARLDERVNDSLGPRVTADGKFLLFYSNRPGGLGGYDIWAAPRVAGEGSESPSTKS